MPNMRATTKDKYAIMVPVSWTVQIRPEVGGLGTGVGGVCDWGVMLWGVDVCIVEGAAMFCNGMRMLLFCDPDDPLCCWLDVGCTAAMDATILNPYGSCNRVTFFYYII